MGRRAEEQPVPGIEEFQNNTFAAKIYKQAYKRAFPIFADYSQTNDVQAQANDMAISFACARANEYLFSEEQIKAMADEIFIVGEQIRIERGWDEPNQEADNFAWQLRGTNKYAQELRIAQRTGRLFSLVNEHGRARNIGFGSLIRFLNIPDLSSPEDPFKTQGRLMWEFSIDFMRRLGFLRDMETPLDTTARAELFGWKGPLNKKMHPTKSAVIFHPSKPFKTEFWSMGEREEHGQDFYSNTWLEFFYSPTLSRKLHA